jgi:hypothetical protein
LMELEADDASALPDTLGVKVKSRKLLAEAPTLSLRYAPQCRMPCEYPLQISPSLVRCSGSCKLPERHQGACICFSPLHIPCRLNALPRAIIQFEVDLQVTEGDTGSDKRMMLLPCLAVVLSSLSSHAALLRCTLTPKVNRGMTFRFVKDVRLVNEGQQVAVPRQLPYPVGRYCCYCGQPAQIPYWRCWYCHESPTYHHGRCCPLKPPEDVRADMGRTRAPVRIRKDLPEPAEETQDRHTSVCKIRAPT